MKISRRDFLKISAVTTAGTFATTLGLPRAFGQADNPEGHPDGPLFFDRGYLAKMTGNHRPSICPFCSVGCGIGIFTGGIMEGEDEVIHIEGDPDNPINGCPDLKYTTGDTMGGGLCPKAQHIYYISQRDKNRNPKRLTKVLHRKPGGKDWDELDFGDAMARVVEKIKATRDATFKRINDSGQVVNRCEGIGFIGGSTLNNEPNYAFSKLLRSLGCVYVDNEARDSSATAIKAMKATFGRPGMTNTLPDMRNASQVLIVGANPAADQPVAMRWVFEAQDRNAASIIVVDPRLSRTAAKATDHVKIRPGTDLALIGGMINYVLSDPKNPYHENYVIRNTDATFLLNRRFLSAQDLRGVFSGFDEESRTYDKSTWKYRLEPSGMPRQDINVEEPRTVLNVLKKHFERYKPALVCRICGITTAQLNEICSKFAETGGKSRAGVVLFGRGVMSSTLGAQTVRAIAILQMLLGNIGVPGGGMVPLLTSSNTQGACDMGLLAEYLPGYLEMPLAGENSLDAYLKRVTPVSLDPSSQNEWKDYKIFMINLLRAFFGETATADNDWNFSMLPKLDPVTDYTTAGMFEAMNEGEVKGLVVLGENPALGPNAAARRRAIGKLDWLVVGDIFESETAAFWKSPDVPSSNTEVFVFPAPTVGERSGTVTNMSRWVQWQQRALSPSEDDKNRKEVIHLAAGMINGLKTAYESDGMYPEPLLALSWEDVQKDPEVMMYEIAGNKLDSAAATLKSVRELAADGSTRCGCWLYAGASQKELNRRNSYRSVDPSGIGLYREFAWSWPGNVRIMYNRASVNEEGLPYNPLRELVGYGQGKWKQNDLLDGPDKAPLEVRPFVATPVGVGKLFAQGMEDGPFPEFYEPPESRVKNWLAPGHQTNPLIRKSSLDKLAGFGSDLSKKYPVIGLTYSLSEHHGYGEVTRYSKGASELVPGFFVEVGSELAKEKSISSGDTVKVASPRNPEGITAKAIVTDRLEAVRILKDNLHMIAVPENFGFVAGPAGAPAHDLTPITGDPNTSSAACRTFLCDISKA